MGMGHNRAFGHWGGVMCHWTEPEVTWEWLCLLTKPK